MRPLFVGSSLSGIPAAISSREIAAGILVENCFRQRNLGNNVFTVAILAQGTIWAVATTQAFGSKPARDKLPSGIFFGSSRRESSSGVLVGNCRREFPSGIPFGKFPREPPSGIHFGNSPREFSSGIPVGKSPRELPSGIDLGSSPREFSSGIPVGNSPPHLPSLHPRWSRLASKQTHKFTHSFLRSVLVSYSLVRRGWGRKGAKPPFFFFFFFFFLLRLEWNPAFTIKFQGAPDASGCTILPLTAIPR